MRPTSRTSLQQESFEIIALRSTENFSAVFIHMGKWLYFSLMFLTCVKILLSVFATVNGPLASIRPRHCAFYSLIKVAMSGFFNVAPIPIPPLAPWPVYQEKHQALRMPV